jgi:hypothetical protein
VVTDFQKISPLGKGGIIGDAAEKGKARQERRRASTNEKRHPEVSS